MVPNRRVVVLVDNSVSVTGALKCAVQQAVLMAPYCRYVLVLPEGSTALAYVQAHGLKVYTLPLLEIQRKLYVLVRYPVRLLLNARRLHTIMKKEGAGLLVMNDYYNLLGACIKMQNPGVHLVTFVRFLPKSIPSVLNRLWTAAAFRYAHTVVAVSEAVRNQLPDHAKVKLLYDSVQFVEQHPAYRVRINSESIELLYLGNYIRGKGQDHAIRAFAQAYQKDQRLRLTFVGGTMGLPKNKVFRAELEQFAAAHGISGVIRFQSFARDVEKVYKSADIFLNFSEAESFSMTCAEAAFYGVPTIASKCGGPEEIIVDGKTGILLPNRDIEGFARGILSLAGNEHQRSTFSLQSRNYVRQKFSAGRFCKELIGHLQLPVPITPRDAHV